MSLESRFQIWADFPLKSLTDTKRIEVSFCVYEMIHDYHSKCNTLMRCLVKGPSFKR